STGARQPGTRVVNSAADNIGADRISQTLRCDLSVHARRLWQSNTRRLRFSSTRLPYRTTGRRQRRIAPFERRSGVERPSVESTPRASPHLLGTGRTYA